MSCFDVFSCISSISKYSTITARHAADAVGANIRPQHRRRPAEESRCKCKRRLQLLLLSHTLRIENQRICSAVCDYLSCSLWLHYLPLHVFQALESKLASCRNFVNSQPRHSKPGSVSSPSHSPRSVSRCLDVGSRGGEACFALTFLPRPSNAIIRMSACFLRHLAMQRLFPVEMQRVH